MARQELRHASERRPGRGHVAERQIRVERFVVELRIDQAGGEQALQFRSEQEEAVGACVVERLDAEPVAGEHRAAPASVPDRDRELAAQQPHEVGALALVQVRDHLGVAAAREPMPLPLERAPQLDVVVQLPVLRRPHRARLVRHRLVAAGEIDDRKPAHPQRDPRCQMRAAIVRPAMSHQIGHPIEQRTRKRRARLTLELDRSTNTAHARPTLPTRKRALDSRSNRAGFCAASQTVSRRRVGSVLLLLGL